MTITIGSSSCIDHTESRFFPTTSDFKASYEYGTWVPDIVPDNSKDIDVWYESDGNAVRVEFIYRGARPLLIEGMSPLLPNLKETALSAYPYLGAGNNITSILYRCKQRAITVQDKLVTYPEVEFVGDTGEKVYYWNSHLESTHDFICQELQVGSN